MAQNALLTKQNEGKRTDCNNLMDKLYYAEAHMLSPVTRLQIEIGFEATKSSDLSDRGRLSPEINCYV